MPKLIPEVFKTLISNFVYNIPNKESKIYFVLYQKRQFIYPKINILCFHFTFRLRSADWNPENQARE